MPDWTFLTNHAHVLLCIAREPGVRIRDVAVRVQITERAAQRILADLTAAGYLTTSREGRRNRYQVNPTLPLRHPLERDHQIGEILEVFHPAQSPALSVDQQIHAGRWQVMTHARGELRDGELHTEMEAPAWTNCPAAGTGSTPPSPSARPASR